MKALAQKSFTHTGDIQIYEVHIKQNKYPYQIMYYFLLKPWVFFCPAVSCLILGTVFFERRGKQF